MTGRRSTLLVVAAGALAVAGALAPRWAHRHAAAPAVETVDQPALITQAAPSEKAPAQPAAAPATALPAMPPGEADRIAAGLAYLDQIRAIPGAAPLLDDVVEALKHGDPSDFSLANLPVDQNGFAHLNEHSSEVMIKDPELRKKWDKLMDLIAADARRQAAQGH